MSGEWINLQEIPPEDREKTLTRMIILTILAIKTHLQEISKALEAGNSIKARCHLMACGSLNAVLAATVKIPSLIHATEQTQAMIKGMGKELNQTDLELIQGLQKILEESMTNKGGPN